MMKERSELWNTQEQPPTAFDYTELDQDTRAFVQQKAAETHGYLKHTAETMIKIGQNLQAVKQRIGHGRFMAWVQAEFDMSYHTALNCMRIAERFGDKFRNILNLPSSVLYVLAQPSTSEEVIERVETGQVAPTVEAIKAAREAERQERRAREQAEQEKAVLQQQLIEERSVSQHAQEQLLHQLEQVQRSLQERPASSEQIREVKIPVIPDDVQAQLETLRQKVKTLTQQRDVLSQEVTTLGEQTRAILLQEDERGERQQRVRRTWRSQTEAVLQAMAHLLMQWPMPLDAYHFEQDEWARLSQIEDHLERLQAACQHLRETVERTITVES
jgi:hypothetical protein